MDVVHQQHPLRRARRARLQAGAVALLLLASGCRQEEVTTYRVSKEPPPGAEGTAEPLASSHRQAGPPPGMPPGMAGEVPAPPVPSGADVLQWQLPRGWSQTFPGGMRFATFKVPGQGRIDGSVVTLPGDAGGELANVNRWRGQIGLGPTDAAGLASARTAVKSKIGPVNVYDFTSEGTKRSRLIAAIVMVNGSAWFIKLTGDAEPVSAARPAFLELLGSLHRD
jgi:hypothetical protein